MKSMKKVTSLIIVGALALALGACAKNNDNKKDDETKAKETTTAEQTVALETESITEAETETEEVRAEEGFTYASLKESSFSFSSGAGGWCTELTINEDGTFEGTYHDLDYEILDDGDTNQMMYFCKFKGAFGDLEKVDDYTYKTTVKSLTYENEVDTEEVIDGVKYVYTDAYGFDDYKDIIFYLKGSKIAELPDDYIDWVRMSMYDYDTNELPEELPFVGMYNENGKQGFSSYVFADNYESRVNDVKELSDSLKNSMQETEMTQKELNETASQLNELWDVLLNEIWGSLQNNLPEDEMNKLTEEERKWIVDKEAQLEKIKEEYESGSIMPMMYSMKSAELTEARVYELLEYFK